MLTKKGSGASQLSVRLTIGTFNFGMEQGQFSGQQTLGNLTACGVFVQPAVTRGSLDLFFGCDLGAT